MDMSALGISIAADINDFRGPAVSQTGIPTNKIVELHGNCSYEACAKCDLSLCMGTSMRVSPA
ncbi:unnamed protein product, partial [Adineta ricciae]